MCVEMKGIDTKLITKVLKEINEDFHQADKINFALQSDILNELVKCFKQRDMVIRELASSAVRKVACTEMGRKTIVESKLIPVVANLFDDTVMQIRANAYNCLINVAGFTYGIDAVIDAEILKILVDKLVLEKEQEILILILKLIQILLEGEMGTGLILNTQVLSRLN